MAPFYGMCVSGFSHVALYFHYYFIHSFVDL